MNPRHLVAILVFLGCQSDPAGELRDTTTQLLRLSRRLERENKELQTRASKAEWEAYKCAEKLSRSGAGGAP